MKRKTIIKPITFCICSIVLILLVGFCHDIHATNLVQEYSQKSTQSYTEFKGIVIDLETKDGLVFADINLNSTNIRTVTNKEGEFLLKVPNNLLDKMITISYLGYETKEIPLKDLTDKVNIITLKILITELSQVKINTPKDALSLVKAALSRKNVNYYNEQTIMTAFYRETIKKGKKNASLSEAVAEVFKQPYKTLRRDEINLVKSRKNTNYSRLDTIALKLQGGPFTTLYTDIVKYPEYIFDEGIFEYYEFSFDNSTQINDRQVYVVKFKQRESEDAPLYYGKLYIDSENFTLVSAVYSLNLENIEEASEMFVLKKPTKVSVEPTTATYRVDYKTKNGKWHYGYSNIQLAFKVKWKNKLFSSTYTLGIEMAITDWIVNTSEKRKPKSSLKSSIILVDEASGFSDPEFWGEYNIIEPEKSIESAIKKIAKQLKRAQS
jgi:hypothetical protein